MVIFFLNKKVPNTCGLLKATVELKHNKYLLLYILHIPYIKIIYMFRHIWIQKIDKKIFYMKKKLSMDFLSNVYNNRILNVLYLHLSEYVVHIIYNIL